MKNLNLELSTKKNQITNMNEEVIHLKEIDKGNPNVGIEDQDGNRIENQKNISSENADDIELKSNLKTSEDIENNKNNALSSKDGDNSVKKNESEISNKDIISKAFIEEKNILNKNLTTKDIVMSELKENIENMKEPLQKLLENKDTISKEILNKVSVFLDNHINDFKTYNSLNNNYYYLDSPIKYKNEEYPCKLIIKDERKKDKKVDKSNIKIAISLKTKKIGVIDSFIKVNYNNMNIEFQCEEKYYSLINKNKQVLIDKLSKNNYFVSINIKKKLKEFGIIECMDFFQDYNTAAINVKV